MRTTLGTRTTVQTSSEEEGFKGPEDIGDIGGFGGELGGSSGSPSRRSPIGGIDLGKGIDLEKPRAPRSGIGFEVGKSPAGNLGLGLEIPLPVAAPVSARGGVSIDPATGEIRGGYGGLGIGKGPVGASVDVGVDTPKGSQDFGCFKYVTFNVGPFSHTVSKNECEPKKPATSTSTSTPTPPPTSTPQATSFKNCGAFQWMYVLGTAAEYWHTGANANIWPADRASILQNEWQRRMYDGDNGGNKNKLTDAREKGEGYCSPGSGRTLIVHTFTRTQVTFGEPILTTTTSSSPNFPWISISRNQQYKNSESLCRITRQQTMTVFYPDTLPLSFPDTYPCSVTAPEEFWYFRSVTWTASYIVQTIDYLEFPECPAPTPTPTPTPLLLISPPFFPLPNPPPTKKKMDDKCCKAIIQLQLETLRLLGRQLGPNGVMAQSKEKGFIGEEIERTLTPINNPNNPEKVKVRFTTVYQMLMYALKQGIALDTALDPQSYKVPTGKLQNPAYSRDSEHSLKSNDQPNKDKAGNSRELEINKDDAVKMSGFLQQQSYMFKMMQRLEYLFPPGELKDALIAKSLLIPGAKGDIKIHNMIMAYEIQMQYLDATLGNPREILTIKDANPAIEGDQPIEIQSLSISDLLRQNIKFHIDTGGDVDALVNLVLRDLRTNLANRLDQIKTAEMVQALFEDSGMLEQQEYINVHLEADPYGGQWTSGQGFKANPDLEKKTEESTEKVLRDTMKPTEQRVKVSRRHKDEKTDMRDLLRGLADFIQRLLSIPSAGDAGKSIDQLVESAKFKIQTDMALLRQNVTQAAAASRNRTRKRKK